MKAKLYRVTFQKPGVHFTASLNVMASNYRTACAKAEAYGLDAEWDYSGELPYSPEQMQAHWWDLASAQAVLLN